MLVETEPGVRVHVQDVGSGRPVVLVAGLGLSHEAWDGVVTALAHAGHRVVCVDLRGTGGSDKPLGSYAMDRVAADVAAVIDHLDLRDVSLVGWSLGGQVALHLAASAPARLAQVVLLCSNGVRASCSAEFPYGPRPGGLLTALTDGERSNRAARRRSAITSGFHVEPGPDLVQWLIGVHMQMPSWAAVAYYETYLQTDLTARLGDVRIPVLQLMGAEDPVTTIDAAPWVQERLADARLVTLQDCGHFPMFEVRERFEAELLAFLAEADA